MGSEFLVFLRLGFEHITDPGGYDHLLFVAALTAVDLGRWRRLFWLVTAFTVGHSVTLALATLDLIRVSDPLVEILIPVTIAATCAVNLFYRGGEGESDRGGEAPGAGPTRDARIRYGLAMGFGLIHGLGFSNFLRAALGAEESIFTPLFAFNVGLEVGQLAIVAALSIVALALMKWLGMPRRWWVVGVSVIAGLAATSLVIQRV
jgi:hypothetical protein